MAKKSSFFYFGSLFLSFARYLFHLLLLRFLTPAAYGEFLSYVSLLYLLTIPSNAVSLIVTKTVSSFYGQKNYKAINTFFYFILLRTLLPTLFIFLFIITFSGPLSIILKANPQAFYLLATMTIFTFFGAIVRSYLTALQQFVAQVLIGLLELTVLLAVTFIFLQLDFAALSGVIGMLLSTLLGITLTFYLIRKFILPQQTDHQHLTIHSFVIFSFIFSVATMSFLSVDVLLTRYFFSAEDSGLYSALSTIGRMIYFGLTPLAALALPIATSRHSRGDSTISVLSKLILAAILLGGGAVAIFILFPRLMVTILSGSQYVTIIPLVPYMAITQLIFALNYLTLSYLLAIEKNSSTLIMLLFALLQPILVFFYHQSLYQVVTLNLTLQLCLFLSLLIYYKLSSYEQVRS